MVLSPATQAYLAKMAKQSAAEVQKALSSKTPAQPVNKSLQRTIAYPQAPAIIAEANRDGHEEFYITRLLKALIMRDDSIAPYELEIVRKAMNETVDTSGGYLVPAQQSQEIIGLLYSKAVMRMLGAPVIPMTANTLEVPRITGGVTASYSGEAVSISESEQTLGMLRLVARELTCLVPVSNRLIADAGPRVEAMVRNDIAMKMAEVETQKFLLGVGGVEPLGLVNMSGVDVATSVTLANLDYDLVIDLINTVEEADSEATGFVATPTIVNTLRKLKDPTTGLYLWREALSQADMPTLLGRPCAVSNKAKSETTHYLATGNWQNEFVIGDRQAIEFAVSDQVRFESNQTVIRAIARHDCGARREQSFAVLPVTES